MNGRAPRTLAPAFGKAGDISLLRPADAARAMIRALRAHLRTANLQPINEPVVQPVRLPGALGTRNMQRRGMTTNRLKP